MQLDRDPEILREERTIYALLIVVGLVVVVRVAFNHAAVTGGVTLCALMIVLGIVGLGRTRRRRKRLPRARTVRWR